MTHEPQGDGTLITHAHSSCGSPSIIFGPNRFLFDAKVWGTNFSKKKNPFVDNAGNVPSMFNLSMGPGSIY